MDFSFIFIGSTHGFIDDFIKQKEIIELINPEFVLCESLENLSLDTKKKFEDILKNKKISNMTSFDEIMNLIELCYDKNIKLIGIDLANFGFDDTLQEKIKKQEKLSKEEENKIKEILKLRDKIHLEKILEYKDKTNSPLIIIIGSWHLRENSFLINALDNYKIVFPCDKKGNLLTEPRNNKKINYCEIIKNAKIQM
jgi:hypothetical protein